MASPVVGAAGAGHQEMVDEPLEMLEMQEMLASGDEDTNTEDENELEAAELKNLTPELGGDAVSGYSRTA
jgi:hypothetical protein